MKQLVTTLLATVALGAPVAGAQIAEVSAPEPLLADVQTDIYNPIISADGQQLLFSDADYSNLRLYNFADKSVKTVDKAARSGFDAQFTPDGKSIVYVAQQTTPDGINMRQVRSYAIAAGNRVDITEPARVVDRPLLASGGGYSVRLNGKTVKQKAPKNSVRTWGSTLYITVNGKETAYTPVESEAGYLWESLSPDGKKVMFYAAGKGVVITDLKGNILSMPGNYEMPVWYGNDHFVAQNATDDGHQYHSSCIMLVKADGSLSQQLTQPESMTMNPTASFAASKVVYNTIDGRLFSISLTLK